MIGCRNFERENDETSECPGHNYDRERSRTVCGVLLHYPRRRSVPDITALDFPALVE